MNLWWALVMELSCFVGGGLVQYEPLSTTIFEDPVVLSIGAEIGLGPAVVYGSVASDMFVVDIAPLSASPFMNTYQLGVRLEHGPVSAGYEHACFHPSVPYQWIPSRSNVVPAFEGSMDRIWIKARLGGRR